MSRDILNIGGEPIFDNLIVKIETHTTPLTWTVKTTSQLEKPRYVIFALQTGRRNVPSQNDSLFDACNLTNVKLFLNSDFYPYDDMNLDFEYKKVYTLRYVRKISKDVRLQQSRCTVCRGIYYTRSIRSDRLFSPKIDKERYCLDIRIEFESKESIPLNTTAYCLIIHDRIIEYNPLTNVIRKIV